MLVLGESDNNGKLIQTAIQMLHGFYDIQNWHKTEDLKKLYIFVRSQEGLEEKVEHLPKTMLNSGG